MGQSSTIAELVVRFIEKVKSVIKQCASCQVFMLGNDNDELLNSGLNMDQTLLDGRYVTAYFSHEDSMVDL
jgi:hypothetical protein